MGMNEEDQNITYPFQNINKYYQWYSYLCKDINNVRFNHIIWKWKYIMHFLQYYMAAFIHDLQKVKWQWQYWVLLWVIGWACGIILEVVSGLSRQFDWKYRTRWGFQHNSQKDYWGLTYYHYSQLTNYATSVSPERRVSNSNEHSLQFSQ